MNIIIKTALVLSMLTGTLAILLTFSKKWFGNGHKTELTINNRLILNVETECTLLRVLHDNDIQIPASCNSKGTCCECKVKITSSPPPMNAQEQGCLSEKEINDGIRLSCQVYVSNPMSIGLSEDLIINWKPCSIKSIENYSDDLAEISIQTKSTIDYIPGAYIQLQFIEDDDLKEKTITKFYIYNFDANTDVLGFLLDIKENEQVMEKLQQFKNKKLFMSDLSEPSKLADLTICDEKSIGLFLSLVYAGKNTLLVTKKTYQLPKEIDPKRIIVYKDDSELAAALEQLIKTDQVTDSMDLFITGQEATVKTIRKHLLIRKYDHKKIHYEYLER